MRIIVLDGRAFDLVEALIEDLAGGVQPRPSRTYYRSVTKDGHVWCESRDPDEVRRLSSLLPHPSVAIDRFERFDVFEIGTGWRPWVLP